MKKHSGKRVIKAWALVTSRGKLITAKPNNIWVLMDDKRVVPCTITLKEKGRK